MTKINKNKFRKAVIGTGGIMLSIAKNLGVGRTAVYDFCWKYPDMMKLRTDEMEKIIDIGEGSLFKKVSEGEMWAVKYLLATKGKKRGYIERSEVEHTAEITTQIPEEQLKEVIERLKNE